MLLKILIDVVQMLCIFSKRILTHLLLLRQLETLRPIKLSRDAGGRAQVNV